jgi:ZIP family zinc transporter
MIAMTTQGALTGLALSALAGAATPIGGLLAVMTTRRGRFRMWSLGLGVSAGVMVYLSVFDLLPEAAELLRPAGHALSVPGFFVVGLVITWLIDLATHRWVEQCSPVDATSLGLGGPSCAVRPGDGAAEKVSLARTGLVAALAIALHNFPEGIATFVTSSSSLSLGLPVVIAVAIHNVPEGFCVALPILCSTGSAGRAVKYALLAGLAEPLGAIIAWALVGPFVTPSVLGGLFALVAGIMVYVAVDELVPAGRRLGGSRRCLTGFAVGVLLMWLGMALIK